MSCRFDYIIPAPCEILTSLANKIHHTLFSQSHDVFFPGCGALLSNKRRTNQVQSKWHSKPIAEPPARVSVAIYAGRHCAATSSAARVATQTGSRNKQAVGFKEQIDDKSRKIKTKRYSEAITHLRKYPDSSKKILIK